MSRAFSIANILLDQALETPLDYAIPNALKGSIEKGMRVLVPLRKRLCRGTILELKEESPIENLYPIHSLASDSPLVPEDLFKLAIWISEYYCTPLARVMRLILAKSVRDDMGHKQQLFVKLIASKKEVISIIDQLRIKKPSQAKVLDLLLEHPRGLFLSEIAEKAAISKSPVDTLAKKGVILCQAISVDRSPLLDQEYFLTKPKILSEEQGRAFEKISASLKTKEFSAHLLYGVTGSGKTEIYLQAIDLCFSLKKSALFLVPEIALTAQTVERLKSRFTGKIAILHHRLSHGERYDLWHQVRKGAISLVVGPRSALFSPLVNLGLIIVDEEHDGSYKQSDEMPCYNARDLALVRAKICQCTAVLGSATPSLESYYNAEQGKYQLSTLYLRPNDQKLADVTIVDMRAEYAKKRYTLFSDVLLEKIKDRTEKGEQSLLFLNRRGYHAFQLCLKCSSIVECPHCDVGLTYHLGSNLLSCHLCNFQLSPPPRFCAHCGSQDTMQFKGAGTEQVEKALRSIFPTMRTLRIDADTTRHKGSIDLLFKQFRSGKADVLIGTQMVAKGLHFPSVTLVGIINADSALHIPDFRAQESVFQILTQVAGRAGRGELGGEVVIQTALPHHSTIQLAATQNFASFYRQEIEVRKLFAYPPFTHLAKLIFEGEGREETYSAAKKIREILIAQLPENFQILALVPCGHEKIQNRYRFQFLIKGERISILSKILQKISWKALLGRKTRLLIDIDPFSTYF